jgi:hypothetical protein
MAQILENVIRFKWGALPVEQREGVRNFLSNFIIRFTLDEALFRKESTFVNKLNIILVQILKHDWPHKWPSFVPDIVAASKTSETLCENTMKILRLLSEEVFDFARVDLTQAKTKELKSSLNNEFRLIHELCVFVLMNTHKVELVRATLDTLNAYLTWVPLGYIFESNLVELLLQLFPQPAFRNTALQCLSEVRRPCVAMHLHVHACMPRAGSTARPTLVQAHWAGSQAQRGMHAVCVCVHVCARVCLDPRAFLTARALARLLPAPQVGSLVMGPEFNPHFETFYKVFITQLQAVVPPTVNIPDAYEKGTDDQQKFVQNLALFFTGFFKVGRADGWGREACGGRVPRGVPRAGGRMAGHEEGALACVEGNHVCVG